MKNISIKLLMVFAFLQSSVMEGQSKYEIEFAEGLIFTDQFGQSSKSPVFDWFKGYNIQSEMTFWKLFRTEQKLQPRIGLGCTYIWALGVSSSRLHSFYMPLRLGIDYQTKIKTLKLTAYGSNYLLLNKKSQDYTVARSERRFFSNIDLGVRIKTGNRSELSLTSPITIMPMYFIANNSTFEPNAPIIDIWVEMVGLNLGLKYTLGKRATEDSKQRKKVK